MVERVFTLLVEFEKSWEELHRNCFDAPVEGFVVEIDAFPLSQTCDKSFQVLVIRCVFEAQVSAVLHEFQELNRTVFCKLFQRHFDFDLLHLFVFFIFVLSHYVLPWKVSVQEVDEDIAHGF